MLSAARVVVDGAHRLRMDRIQKRSSQSGWASRGLAALKRCFSRRPPSPAAPAAAVSGGSAGLQRIRVDGGRDGREEAAALKAPLLAPPNGRGPPSRGGGAR